MSLLLTLQQVTIAEKVKHAPNSSYQIGIAIGSYLPFVILVIIAYWMYYRAKNRNDNE
ncbi:hypothetical protein [Flavobacterium sp.]|uniref:hypothetical protein n=1 Tax=Flavobacterium sp. TaxID=239 RepID=UPI0038D1AC61